MTATAHAPQPIPTRYKGHQFRSRTEARWAVFFDALGVNWQYEKEGYALPTRPYLPDFEIRVPQSPILVEVKGTVAALNVAVLEDAVMATKRPLLILGDIPQQGIAPYVHPMISPVDGGGTTKHGAVFRADEYGWVALHELRLPSAPHGGRLPWTETAAPVENAYDAARQAQFEHGVQGAPQPLPEANGAKPPGNQPWDFGKYKIHQYLDGQVHVAVQGEDFDCMASSFAKSLRLWARREAVPGLKTKVMDDRVIFRFKK